MPDDAGEPDILLRLADRALYSAKSAGRDCVRTVDPGPGSKVGKEPGLAREAVIQMPPHAG